MRSLGAEPGDADRYARAIDRHIERHAHTLAAERPDWLTALLGDRPADVAGATTWDDAVRDIAHWRARHQLPDHTAGLGDSTRPTRDRRQPAGTRCRPGSGSPAPGSPPPTASTPPTPSSPSRTELLDRRAELDELLAARPADWRTTIAQLRSRPAQPRRHRRPAPSRPRRPGRPGGDWILANWPHVVEYQEINRTLTTGTWGPDPQLLTDLLTQPLTDTLAAAIQRGDPWLRVALSVVADGDTTHLDADAIDWLERLAVAREEQGIAPAAPLDPSWSSPSADPAAVPPIRRARHFGVRRLRPLGERPPVSSRPWGFRYREIFTLTAAPRVRWCPKRPDRAPGEEDSDGRSHTRTWSWALRPQAHP